MYKLASRKLQRVHVVDRPHPSRGYIHGAADPADVLPEACTLSLEEARAESAQLRNEMVRIEQAIHLAKLAGRKAELELLGQQKAPLQNRLGIVNRRVRELDGDNELTRLRLAVRELADSELAERIFARAKELRRQPANDPRNQFAQGDGSVVAGVHGQPTNLGAA